MTPSNDDTPNPEQDEKTRALQDVYRSDSPEKSAAIYNDWSADYEEHMKGVGYAHPAMVAAMFARHQPTGDDMVLDAGSGTGIMAQLLGALGYPNISGLDASEGMLAFAADKELYADLRHQYLGQPLDYADDTFAGACASGVFTQGHAPLDGLDEIVRAVRPGGHVVFSISRTYLGEMFQAKADALTDAGKWTHVEASGHYDSAPLGDDVLTAQVQAFRVN